MNYVGLVFFILDCRSWIVARKNGVQPRRQSGEPWVSKAQDDDAGLIEPIEAV
jgi:hypothetical protein